MKSKLFVFGLLILPFIFQNNPVFAEKIVEENPGNQQIQSKKLDNKAKILAAYLEKFDSPMQYNAQDFIDAASAFGLDWKLLPAIAGVESTFGKHIPGGYNGWGWGVYGDQAIYFSSWKEGIFTIAKGLRENYLNKGYNDPYEINRIYAASPHWGGGVTYFMQDLESFAGNFVDDTIPLSSLDQTPNIAAVSGQLALK